METRTRICTTVFGLVDMDLHDGVRISGHGFARRCSD